MTTNPEIGYIMGYRLYSVYSTFSLFYYTFHFHSIYRSIYKHGETKWIPLSLFILPTREKLERLIINTSLIHIDGIKIYNI